MLTLNGSVSLWRYLQAYGDIGFLKNKNRTAFFAYDSGIRLDLILDYFELYFPIVKFGLKSVKIIIQIKLDLYSLQIFQNWLDYFAEDGLASV